MTMPRRHLLGRILKHPATYIFAVFFYLSCSFLFFDTADDVGRVDVSSIPLQDEEIVRGHDSDPAAFRKKHSRTKKKQPSLQYHVLSAKSEDIPLKYDNIMKLLQMIDRNKHVLDELGIPYRSLTNMEGVVEHQSVNIKQPVIVTAFSSNHFGEAVLMFQGLISSFSNYQVIVYDLGLTEEEVRKVQSILAHFKKKGKIRNFPFEKYEKYNPRIRDLYVYAWKALLIEEAFREYGFIFYVDTSVRILSREFEKLWPFVRKFGLGHLDNGLMHVCFTHPGMFSYFNVSSSAYADEMALDSGAQLYYNLSLTREVIIPAYVACSLDKDCISPPEATVAGCNTKLQAQNVYCGCHRFDQSAITLILSMIFHKPRFTFADPSTESNLSPYAFQGYPGGRQLKIDRSG